MSTKLLLTLLLGALLAGAVTAVAVSSDDGAPPALPAAPRPGQVSLVEARPFTLQTPYTHQWRADRPAVSAGWVLVLRVADRELLHPRQTAEPVLYVGEQTAERLNHGQASGHVVALVPSPVGADGLPSLDLTGAPVFFGDPALPEQVTAAEARRQLDAARARGVAAFDAAALTAARAEAVHFVDDSDLRTWSADIIERWSPQEADLVAGLRVERVGR